MSEVYDASGSININSYQSADRRIIWFLLLYHCYPNVWIGVIGAILVALNYLNRINYSSHNKTDSIHSLDNSLYTIVKIYSSSGGSVLVLLTHSLFQNPWKSLMQFLSFIIAIISIDIVDLWRYNVTVFNKTWKKSHLKVKQMTVAYLNDGLIYRMKSKLEPNWITFWI